MKKLLTGILCLTLSMTLSAQGTNSENTVEVTTTDAVFKTGNAIYLKHVKSKDAAIKVKKLQNLVATYNIEESDLFNKKKKTATYDVVFKESNCKIVATFNADGTIVRTNEEFSNVKLPYELSSEIAKQYPKWSFADNTQFVEYTNKEGATKIYIVKIKNNDQSKTLKFKVTASATLTDYVALN